MVNNNNSSSFYRRAMQLYKRIGNVNLILVGLIVGVIVGNFLPTVGVKVSILGELFVSALKAVAPLLIFVLVLTSIARHQAGRQTEVRSILILYLVATLLSALVAVIASYLFPTTLILSSGVEDLAPPSNIIDVFKGVVLNMVDNPVNALLTGNFIGILVWGAALGFALNRASVGTKELLGDLSEGVSTIVRWVIAFAPLGIFGIVASTIANFGNEILKDYGHLLLVLLGSMAVIAFIVNPILVYWKIRRNPYPLVWATLRESGVSAFFTRSSAANIPVNMAMCARLNLDKDTYSISIPLGATINMGGAAITITILTLAAVNTIGIEVTLPMALLLSIVAALSACGASGVAGGSLLLIPLAASLFGISNEVAMQIVAVGFAIGVLQDSAETALNSSTDVLFTAAACMAADNRS